MLSEYLPDKQGPTFLLRSKRIFPSSLFIIIVDFELCLSDRHI
jgi:hypothetical protein